MLSINFQIFKLFVATFQQHISLIEDCC